MIQRLRNYQVKPKMKTLFIVTCACLFFVACASSVFGNGTDELHVCVAWTTGARGRDTSSEFTTITVARDAIVWERTYSSWKGRPPFRKEFKLPPADKENLLKLIRSNNLLVTDSIGGPPRSPSNFRNFRISVALTLDGKKGAIIINGPRTAVKVKEERLYQKTLTLVKELYRIMNSQDESVRFEELILEP